jgi:hypothetical protein
MTDTPFSDPLTEQMEATRTAGRAARLERIATACMGGLLANPQRERTDHQLAVASISAAKELIAQLEREHP